MQESRPGRLGVAEGDQHGVQNQEVDRPLTEVAVPFDQTVLPDGSLHERDPGDQQHHYEQQVGARQPEQPPEEGCDTARGG